MNERDLGQALFAALGQVVGAMAGGQAEATDAPAPSTDQWTVTLSTEGFLRAVCVLSFDHAGAAALSAALVGQEDAGAIEGVLRDAVGKAIDVLIADERTAGLQVALRAIARSEVAPSGTALAGRSLEAAGLRAPLQVGYYAVLAPSAAATRPRSTERVSASEQQSRLDVILDIDLPVVVRFGRTEMPLRAVTRLGPGSVIDLGRAPDDPVELLVSDRVVARGEVVVVSGNYGIRIVDVVSPSERMRSLEG